jgi:hypothetical protein
MSKRLLKKEGRKPAMKRSNCKRNRIRESGKKPLGGTKKPNLTPR